MKNLLETKICLVILAIAFCAMIVESQRKPAVSTKAVEGVGGGQPANAVCPNPTKPCHHKQYRFEDWELSFRLPVRLAPNKTYSSARFYAVILKAVKPIEDCQGYDDAIENERKQIQKTQRERKVFASYSCVDMYGVSYDFKGKTENFIAVYAGQTAEQAETLRRTLLDKYPQAVAKGVTANWENMVQ